MGRFVNYRLRGAREATSQVVINSTTRGYSRNERKRRPRLMAIVLIIGFGLAAGWLGGKVLSSRYSQLEPALDGSAVDVSAELSNSQPEANSERRARGRVAGSDVPRSESLPAAEPEPEKPVGQREPPRVPRVDKDEGDAEKSVTETPVEEPEKEIGRKALQKILKEREKMRRGKRLKEEKNEDEQV